ncbi:MAG: DUF2075 domain-containing protein [Erysipelotrichaceae bacterium]|nr:DUF2075 domain-containing protein [Erysipelotrichaceae bacterium]
MTNSDVKIKDLRFNKNTPKMLEESNFYNEWPVVYILNNKKQMYIGETYHAAERMKQHIKNPRRKNLTEAHIIASDDFTKSATLDIESSLIELCSSMSDSKRILQNENNGIVKHYYANKEEFSQDSRFFSRLWKKLQDRGLVTGSIENLKNTDLFKYSPYKSLNAEQCTTRDYIVEDILDAFVNNLNRTIFVNGGAGTGKTILAIYLMKLLVTNAEYITEDDESEMLPFISDLKEIHKIKKELKIAYVVSMVSFRNTLKTVFGSVKGLKPSMVISPSEASKDKYDILLVDEAHRLKKRKNLSSPGEYNNFDKVNKKLGLKCEKEETDGNQLDWIVNSSQIQVLFYDEKQSVKPTDIDKKVFNKIKNEKFYHTLSSQMRCIGGVDYIKYIDDILNQRIEVRKKIPNEYDFRLFENINDFCNVILTKEKENELCRIVSGYGYEWISKKGTKDKPNPRENEPDIIIDNREFFWNKKDKEWPNSIKGDRVVMEVGCIHTIQGYDLNYCGVIFGPEIVFQNGIIKIDKKNYYDTKGKAGIISDSELKEYVINIYKVLLSRGIKGTYVYVCDNKLREYLKRFIPY